jgi:hypothetical protein
VAIVSLGVPLLALKHKHFVLEADVVKLDCDTVFDRFTPLSQLDTDDHHEFENALLFQLADYLSRIRADASQVASLFLVGEGIPSVPSWLRTLPTSGSLII